VPEPPYVSGEEMKDTLGLGYITLAAIVCVAVGAGGCFTAENSERRQLAALEKGIETDRFAIDRVTPRVEEKVTTEGAEKSPPRSDPPVPPPPVPPEQASNGDEAADNTPTTPRTVIKIWGKSTPSVEVVPAAFAAKDSAARVAAPSESSTEAERSYTAALSLVNAHAYDRAAGALGIFLLEWPNDANAGNAMYWQAECYFAMGEYTHAAELFEQAIERFPKGSRVPDSLLRLGMCEEKLGDTAKAKTYFDRLGTEYPKSEAARRVPSKT
jgi:tol-pal system protein YbgF